MKEISNWTVPTLPTSGYSCYFGMGSAYNADRHANVSQKMFSRTLQYCYLQLIPCPYCFFLLLITRGQVVAVMPPTAPQAAPCLTMLQFPNALSVPLSW